MIGYIYKIINKIDGKFYIGSTINFEKRKKSHLNALNKNKHHNIFLQRAFEKYGVDSFIFSVKEKNVKSVKELYLLEERYINFCWNSGKLYNLSKKGCGGDLISYHPNNDEFREKQSRITRERYSNMSKEEKENLSKKLMGENNPNFGNRWSEEQRLKASERMKNSKTSFMYNLKGKTFEEVYGEEKAKKIKEKLSNIASQRVGEKNSFYGKRHSEETKKLLSEKRKGVKSVNGKKVSYKGKIYESANDCAKELGLKHVTVCYRARNNIYGFHYIGENDNEEQRNARMMWNKEKCEEIAKTCKTKKEFREKNVSAYSYAKDKGFLKEFCDKYFIELRHYWSLDEIIGICEKYDTYCDFRKNEKKLYFSLCRHSEWKEKIKEIFNN